MGLALGKVESNGHAIGENGTSFGMENHEFLTNEIIPCLQPPKWEKKCTVATVARGGGHLITSNRLYCSHNMKT